MATPQKRSFIELYNKFQNVYERLTNGRRDMKTFCDLLHALQSSEEKYHQNLEAGLKKALAPILNTTLAAMYNEVKSGIGNLSRFHQGVLASTYKDLAQQVEVNIKEVKIAKTKYLDQYTKLVKEVEAKKAAHVKARAVYEASVGKAESAVANFRCGRSQVGNDKQVKKLEEAMHNASKELEKNHAAYLKAVSECQQCQSRYETETEQLLLQFEELEQRRLATYQAIMTRFVEVQGQHKDQLISTFDQLSATCHKVNPPQDILDFIQDTFDGKPLDAHAFYEPQNSEVIPHYGDVGRLAESQQHLTQVQTNHRRLMMNSTHQPAQYNLQGVNGSSNPGLTSQPSFIGQPSNAAFAAGNPGAGTADATVAPAAAASGSSAGAKSTLRCTALYDFVGQEPGDLSFVTNQVIELITCDPQEDWWFGQINGIQGAFPKSYVSAPVEVTADAPVAAAITTAAASPPPLSVPAATPGPVADIPAKPDGALFMVKATFEFQGQEADELTLAVGDVLSVYAIVEDWYEGVNAAGQRGIFPNNHVAKL